MTALRFTAVLALGLATAGPALAGASLVVDASTGDVLSSENATQAWRPASTAKMMTIYLALKAVRDGRIGLETAIPASKRAASQPRVKVYIKPGQEVTLDNALRIMMVKSANDIAYVVAEGVGGDVESFVGMMNAEARRLGMRDTRFMNPNGWDNPDQQVSAHDLALLAMALMRDFPDYSDYWGTPAVQLGKQLIHNTNGLVGRYPGISGMKTGFTCASGFNVVATASRGGRTLIAVVLGSTSATDRTVKAAQLLDEGFAKWGGTGINLASMPPSGTRAPNVCDEVRNRGGGAMADDADVAGPVGGQDSTSDNAGRFLTFATQSASTSIVTRSPRGRLVLGPRAEPNPIQVTFGRTAGSDRAPLAANAASQPASRVARGAPTIVPGAPVTAGLTGGPAPRTASGNGAIPRGTTAFAPANTPVQPSSDAFESGPMRLQGAVQSGQATAASLRPAAGAGIKAAAPKTAGKAQAAVKAKPAARPKAISAASVAKPAKPAAKTKLPTGDDD
ncbi:D-alanyl-D-alanine carboxypeptidase family protein [Bosea sp. TND4EK4]|uniref:D-alanyl-D-alanine carboxypeptidase family protein n=1 Tax=Bosea sp. TND4EK4 TaxID=1907408 RepID=UPI000956D7C4|nr:D-alanyl-D-alanine carboxypeptidase family protein [Bosea sp. TND4EK4]SIR23987.1 D-alanyl-D-alanine carboxypeptidase [Bosea sp. TND4EK4]